MTEEAHGLKDRIPIKPLCTVIVTNFFSSEHDSGVLNLMVDDIVYVLNTPNSKWWDGIVVDPAGTVIRGWFPPSCTRVISPEPTPHTSVSTTREDRRTVDSLPVQKTSSSVSHNSLHTPTSTDERSRSINLTSIEEIDSYFTPVSSQPSFNFMPVWIPQITQDNEFIYYNSALNVHSKELPLISADYVDDGSAVEIPDPSKFNGIPTVPIDVKETVEPQRPADKPEDPPQQHIPTRETSVYCQAHSDVSLWYNPDLFYHSPGDVTNWNMMIKRLRYLVGMCMDAMNKNNQKLFNIHLNHVGSDITLLHQLSNLIIKDLQNNNILEAVKQLLRKITTSLMQLTINGQLEFVSLRMEQTNSDPESDDEPEGSPENSCRFSEVYYKRAEINGIKLLKRVDVLREIFMNLKYEQNVDPNGIPLLYPRFFKNRFHAGNLTNPFDDMDSTSNVAENLFIDHQSRKNNILLNDETIESLVEARNQACELLKEVSVVLTTPIPTETKYNDFLDDRNLNISTLIYRCVPSLSRFLNQLESIDFTIFVMVNRLSKKERPQFEGFSEEEPSDSNVLFYETTSKQVEPLLTEFMTLKQNLHIVLSDLIIDAQNMTVEDPEVFKGLKDDEVFYDKGAQSMKTEKFSQMLIKNLQKQDLESLDNGLYLLDSNLKLRATISKAMEQFKLLIISVTQLKEERQTILNYCSRLMNTDFNVASLFVAERHNTMVSANSQSEFYYERRSSLDGEQELPWFLGADDDEKSLIFDTSGVKGGPVDGLISRMVNPSHPNDEEYKNTVLALFVTFMTPLQFFDSLIARYNLEMPEGLSYEEYSVWIDRKRNLQRKEIMRLFAKLFSEKWLCLYSSPELLDKWNRFITENEVDPKVAQLGQLVISMQEQPEWFAAFGNGNPVPEKKNQRPPIPLMLGKNIRNAPRLRLRDIDATELARQLTLIQFELFHKIDKFDLLARSYRSGRIFKHSCLSKFVNIANFIKNCNQITHFVIHMILRQRDLQARAENIKYFVIVADKLMKLRNFSSMTAIVSGLSSTSISRLKKTWSHVPTHIVSNFEKMDQLMSIGKNYSEYRNVLKFINEDEDPCLPFLGMYLSDLRFLTDGNPDYLHDSNKLINFSKRLNIYRTIEEVIKFNNRNYHFEKIDELWTYLREIWNNLPDEDKLYSISLKLEPLVSLVNQQQDSDKKFLGINARVA
ncbi:hypothetical protein OGAPHI_003296 [Ogataea philodendri]|uniref:Cell division control protein 25 n=1 Tax=Ogataea philodendri TaxID=1378263 RepID=A0A9P8P7R2_9ASCO|nr:uncharacterized protein OGAPHI_003296 [Ogataea philodendri]KAH3666847.1 hypothetical protein OGAPHI_003296 [Ogataea philodendri]